MAREDRPAGPEAAKAGPHRLAVGPGPAARARQLAEMPVGAQGVDQPEVAGPAAVRVGMPECRLRAATEQVGTCQGLARGQERTPKAG